MKIKVITRHAPSNYGSLLQSIATIKVMEGMGHDCEIIDYQRPDERGLAGVITQLSQKEGYGNPIKQLVYIALRYPIEKYAQMKFESMRKKYPSYASAGRKIHRAGGKGSGCGADASHGAWRW